MAKNLVDDYFLWVSGGVASTDFAIADVSEWNGDGSGKGSAKHSSTARHSTKAATSRRRLTEMFPSATHVKGGVEAVSVKEVMRLLSKKMEDLSATVEAQAKRIQQLESESRTIGTNE